MHPGIARLAVLPALTSLACGALACGDSSSDGSFGDSVSASQPSAASADTDTTATPTSVPTTSADPTGDAETGIGPTSASTTSTTADNTTTADDTTTAVTITTADDTTSTSTTADDTTSTTADDTTGNNCPEGSQGCPCGPDDACDLGLECQNDLCLPPNCPQGTQGCPCGPNNSCNNGLQCQAGLCVDAPVCGDGVVEGNEACDLGGQNSNTGACKLDCTKQACGDGYVGPGEACDDGNGSNGDGCEANCTKTPQGLDNCGQPSDGLWIEIDYDSAQSPTNPDWAYGGWTEPEWAPQGNDWPYINALGGIVIHEDQGVIGTTALLDGTNKELRVFIGLAGLVTYDYVTACVEGRSYSVGSSVTFRVENALNDCGGQAMMSNDWFSLHPTTVDVGDNCFIPGNDFQAIAIRPVSGSGSLSLKRLRVTFHGAVY